MAEPQVSVPRAPPRLPETYSLLIPSQHEHLRTGICWLNPRETRTNHSQLLLRDPGFFLCSGSSQNLRVPEGMCPVPAGVGRVLRVGSAAPRCVGSSLGGLRGELAKGRRRVLSAAGEACVLGAGGAIARSAHTSRACWVGSCVRGGAAAGFSLRGE